MAEMGETERSYNILERLLFYLLPVLFTLLLTGVLLNVFGYDIVNAILRVGDKIPGVSAILPDPKPTEEELRSMLAEKAEKENEVAAVEQEAESSAQVAQLSAEIASLKSETEQKDQRISELEKALEEMQTTAEREAATEEQYAANIKQLASVYAGMKPSKSAPVLENLTLNERVLVLKEMTEEEQIDILEKMDPTIAAETSILMKDAVAVRDLQIAALQERLALNGEQSGNASLTRDEISRTISRMAPDLAAEVLLEIAASDQELVVGILRAMEETSRATVLNSLAELDKAQAATLTARLS